MEERRAAFRRGLTGGLLGVVILIPLGGVFNAIIGGALIAMGTQAPFQLVSGGLEVLTGSWALGLVIELGLYFALGAAAGLSTMPFAEGGRTLARRSLLHFAATAGLLTLTCRLLGWAWSWRVMGVYLVMLGVVYLVIWAVRWVGWYFELGAIRKKLKLGKGKEKRHEKVRK